MTVQLSSLRVSAQLDASQYAAGAAQKVAADQAMTASAQGVGQAVTQTQQKISASGDVLARLSRQYVDGYAAAQRMESALNQLSRGVDAGKIKMVEAGAILDGIYRKYGLMADASLFLARGQNELAAAVTNANAKLAQQRLPTPANQNRLSSGQLQGLGYQANDVVTMALLGASPSQIAFSQGGQILQTLQMGEGGIAGSLNAIKGSAAAAGTALVGTLGTVGLIATGFGAAAVAAGAFYLATREKAKDLKDATDAQREAVMDLAKAYNDASLKADDFYEKSIIASESAARRTTSDLQKSAQVEYSSIQSQLGSPYTIGRGQQTYYGVRPEFAAFGSAISILNGQIERGAPNFDQFEKSIAAVVAQNPGLQTTADKILAIVAAATEAAGKLNTTVGYLRDISRASVGNFDRTQQAGQDASIMRQRFGDDPFADLREQQRQKEKALTEAQDERRRSLDQTIASAQLDVDLIGKTTAEVEALRMAFQLEQQVREEAAKNNIKVDEAEIARIQQKAAEYGKLRALQQAREIVRGQQDDLELQRAEISLVGENKLAHDRVIDALKTEQEIRKLGIPLYGQEANAMRASTAAASDNAEALAHATMQADLLFQRRQILRNSEDQQIASALHSAGLPDDLNSVEAQMMRYNMALQETKDTFKGFFTDMFSGLREGKSLWESFRDAAVNALGRIADKLIDRGLDGIFNSIFGGPQAGSGQGLVGQLLNLGNGTSGSQQASTGSGLLSSLIGGRSSVASMQVQAASVFINGAPVGAPGLGSLTSFLGGSSFQPNTTLSDVLGYTGGGSAANQNYIQTRIDQAFGTSQDYIQSRIDSAFGTGSAGLGGIFSPAGGFASVLGGSSLTGSMSQYAAAIRAVESLGSGGYSALGPLLRNGDQALGAYQIMASNLPSWSQSALGRSVSRSEFMGSPDIQDAIFNHQFGSYVSKYGNPQDAASAWFTGGPLSSGAGRRDVLGTTGSQYVDKFNSALERLGGTTQQATGALTSLGGASQGLISQFSQIGQSLLGSLTPATSSSSWFQGLSGMFGGFSGALGFMNSISPMATADILSGSWGLFDDGGFTGSGGRNQPAGIVHRGEIVWSQDDIRRAGGVHVVEGMRRGLRGYAEGGWADRIRSSYSGRHNDSWGASADRSGGRHNGANDDRRQTVNLTNNFIFRESPSTPASQNQLAAKTARSVEKVNRTA